MCTPVDTIYETVRAYYVKPVPMIGGVICGLTAAEAALRLIGNIFSPADPAIADPKETKREISRNLGKAIFYSLCAANIVPGTAFIGASIFACRSIFSSVKADKESLTAKCFRVPTTWALGVVSEMTFLPAVKTENFFLKGLLGTIGLEPTDAWLGVATFIPAYYYRNYIGFGLTKVAEWSRQFFLVIQ